MSSKLMKMLDLKVPLIVAPMAGGFSSPELVVAACEAGALGSIGAAYSAPAEIEELVNHVRAQTSKNILMNLFIPSAEPKMTAAQISKAIKATEKYRKKFDLPAPKLQPPFEENFDRQFEVVLKCKPKVFSFVFGLLKPEYIKAAKNENILLFGTATTLEEALALEESGVDAITLQGFEGGGHRGIFNANSDDQEVPLLKLLVECQSKIKTPLIAAGGIMNSQDIKSALSRGAELVQMGTAFLNCQEAGTNPPYRKALQGTSRKTRTTRAFSGRLARGVENLFMCDIDSQADAILPFPAQNKFTRDIRTASAKNNSSDCLSLWAGSGQGEPWTGSAKSLINNLFSI